MNGVHGKRKRGGVFRNAHSKRKMRGTGPGAHQPSKVLVSRETRDCCTKSFARNTRTLTRRLLYTIHFTKRPAAFRGSLTGRVRCRDPLPAPQPRLCKRSGVYDTGATRFPNGHHPCLPAKHSAPWSRFLPNKPPGNIIRLGCAAGIVPAGDLAFGVLLVGATAGKPHQGLRRACRAVGCAAP